MLERSARYGSDAAVTQMMNLCAYQASLSTQVVDITIPFNPNLLAGQVVGISATDLGPTTNYYVVLRMESTVGSEDFGGNSHNNICQSRLICRNISAYAGGYT